jgi:hypothetical protein
VQIFWEVWLSIQDNINSPYRWSAIGLQTRNLSQDFVEVGLLICSLFWEDCFVFGFGKFVIC